MYNKYIINEANFSSICLVNRMWEIYIQFFHFGGQFFLKKLEDLHLFVSEKYSYLYRKSDDYYAVKHFTAPKK